MTTAARRIRATASVFELPQRLGILQYVEYEPPREWCTDGCLYEGVLTARRGGWLHQATSGGCSVGVVGEIRHGAVV